MLIIALTGGIGSGKTTVAKLFAELDVPVIDADAIAHELTSKGSFFLNKIVEHFGASVLDEHGSLNRKELGNLVFQNPSERLWLENLLHPEIRKVMHARVRSLRAPYVIFVIPLLAETQRVDHIDRVLVVDTPEALQIERAKARDNLSDARIYEILRAQASRKDRLALADDVIVNDSTLAILRGRVKELHKKYLEAAHEL